MWLMNCIKKINTQFIQKVLSIQDTINKYVHLIKKYHIKSIEDPFAEDHWNAWAKLMNKKPKMFK